MFTGSRFDTVHIITFLSSRRHAPSLVLFPLSIVLKIWLKCTEHLQVYHEVAGTEDFVTKFVIVLNDNI